MEPVDRITALRDVIKRHPSASAVLGVMGVVGAYDTFSGQVEQLTGREIPSLHEIFGWSVVVGGHLLPWWAWIIMLLMTFNAILLWHLRDGRSPPLGTHPQGLQALQQQVAALVASTTPAPPPTALGTPQYAVDLSKQIDALRAIKLYERRDHLLSELNGLIEEGHRIFFGDRETDVFPLDVASWRTQLKNTMTWADQLIPGIDEKVHSVPSTDYVEIAELQLANLMNVTERLEWGFEDIDRI